MTVKHITISGELGSGKSSVATLVSGLRGMELVSTGAVQRHIAASLNLSTLETNLLAEQDRVIDSQVDGVTRGLGETSTEPIVFDSRMAWKMVPKALKVRLIVDPDIAASRIHSRMADKVEIYESLEHAKNQIASRYESEVRRFLARYGVDVSYLKHFDVVIDTSDATPTDVANLISRSYENTEHGPQLFASPRRIIPAFHLASDISRGDDNGPSVLYCRPFIFAITGEEVVAKAIHESRTLLAVNLLAEGLEEIQPGTTAADFVRNGVSPEVVTHWAARFGVTYDSYFTWLKEGAHGGSIL